MNDTVESRLAMAERHVRQFEKIVVRQTALVERLEAGSYYDTAKQAQAFLATFQTNLELARRHAREARGTRP